MTYFGLLKLVRRAAFGGDQRREHDEQCPAAIDLLCVVSESGGVTGSSAGSDAVIVDFASCFNGQLPRVKLPGAAVAAQVAGVVHWQEGAKALGDRVWVRVVGSHPCVKVDGTTDVAAGDMLTSHNATPGALEKTSDPANACGQAWRARTANSIGPLQVELNDRCGLLRY